MTPSEIKRLNGLLVLNDSAPWADILLKRSFTEHEYSLIEQSLDLHKGYILNYWEAAEHVSPSFEVLSRRGKSYTLCEWLNEVILCT